MREESIVARVGMVGVWLACLLAVGACVSVRTIGAANADDLAAEEAYKAAYTRGNTGVQQANQLFAPSEGNPGVCNIGGTKQGCVDADHAAEAAFRQMLAELDAVKLPPRFADGDRLLRQGIDGMIRGLELRDQALIDNDDAAFTEHKAILEQAEADLQAANKAYPADNWPVTP